MLGTWLRLIRFFVRGLRNRIYEKNEGDTRFCCTIGVGVVAVMGFSVDVNVVLRVWLFEFEVGLALKSWAL